MISNIIIIFAHLTLIESAKILVVVPTPSISHQVVFRPLVQELINRNHEVILITTDPVHSQGKSPKNLTEIDLHYLSYNMWHKWFREISNIDQEDYLTKLSVGIALISEVYEEQLKHKRVKELLKDKTLKIDLVIVEHMINAPLILSHIFKAPIIQMSSFGSNPGNLEMMGGLTHPLLYPMQFRRRIYNLNILEKINELWKDLLIDRIFKKQQFKDDIMLQKVLGSDIPPLSKIKNNVCMLFLNIHSIWVHSQPIPPSVIYTSGMYKTPEKLLPKDLQSYLDSSTNGAIYFSFGTNFKASSIPAETIQMFLTVFSRLPYNILWKYDADSLPGELDNIKISKWFPQGDILRHPNLKVFITQGGLQSTEEAINAGVPLIGIPTVGDQEYNIEKYVHFEIGIKLNFESLTAEKFEHAIITIFKDYDSYRRNIVALRTQMQDQPKPPLENAVWWIEYILHHGRERQLRSPAANMSWTEYYELELGLLLLSGLIFSMSLLYFCLKFIL